MDAMMAETACMLLPLSPIFAENTLKLSHSTPRRWLLNARDISSREIS